MALHSVVSFGKELLLKQSRSRYCVDIIPFHPPHYYTAIAGNSLICIFFNSIAEGYKHLKAILINNVLEQVE